MSIYQLSTTAAVETSALDAGDTVSNAILSWTLPKGVKKGKIICVQVIDNDKQTAANNARALYFFSKTVTQAAADAAFALSDADAQFFIGRVSMASGDFLLSASNTLGQTIPAVPVPFLSLEDPGKIYAQDIITATPTYAGGFLTYNIWIEVEGV